MSGRRMLAWVAVYVAAGLAVLGFMLFTVGLLIEFIVGRSQPLQESLSPVMQLALAGLCLTALMVTLAFGLIGLLLAWQTRQLAPGYGDAYRFMEHSQFNQAIPLLERAVRGGHETADILMLLTSAYAQTGQLAKAQATADRAVQLYPQDPSAYITLANGYRLQASYEEAAWALQTAADLAPEQPIVWAELGFVHLMVNNQEAAFKAFQRAAEMPMPASYSVRVYYHLTRAYREKADHADAEQARELMIQASSGLKAWLPVVTALEGTVYGHTLRYEIAAIEEALQAADAST